jgi:hypothetical protein
MAAAGEAVVRQQAKAEHVGAAALARVAAAAADQLLRRLPAAAAACARAAAPRQHARRDSPPAACAGARRTCLYGDHSADCCSSAACETDVTNYRSITEIEPAAAGCQDGRTPLRVRRAAAAQALMRGSAAPGRSGCPGRSGRPDARRWARTGAQALKGGLVGGHAAAEAHVGQLGAAAGGQQHVLRLDVAVHDAALVQRHQAAPGLGHHLRPARGHELALQRQSEDREDMRASMVLWTSTADALTADPCP